MKKNMSPHEVVRSLSDAELRQAVQEALEWRRKTAQLNTYRDRPR